MFGAGAKNCRVTRSSGLVRHGGFDWLAANDALKTHHSHKPSDGAAGDVVTFSMQLPPDFAHAIDLEILVEHPAYLYFHGNIIPFAGRWRSTYVRLAITSQ